MPKKVEAYDPGTLPGMLKATRVQRQIKQELGEIALLTLGSPLNKWEVPDEEEEDAADIDV